MEANIRSPFIRLLYKKLQHQNKEKDGKHWYTCRVQLLESFLVEKFLLLCQDEETEEFINKCCEKSDWFFTHMYYAFAKLVLTWFMTSTSINGYLGCGSMFVFSSDQFCRLLNISSDFKADSLLDLGAGDGNVTLRMAPFFDKIFVTELSPAMRLRLAQHHFNVLDAETWQYPSNRLHSNSPPVPSSFDVISCLNLLDRCTNPISLLNRIHQVLKPQTGIFIMALVLPFKQYVEFTSDKRPLEYLSINPQSEWEVQLGDLVRNVVIPANFDLICWTRLPYLCEGDFSQSFYYLNDVVLVLRAASQQR